MASTTFCVNAPPMVLTPIMVVGLMLFVHGRDSRIRERDSHGHDPNPPKG
jgi:hypothetical protein